MRLLLIEDNAALAGLLTKGLTAAGFEVDTVSTVADSLAVLATTRFSAIVLDLGLPDGEGLTVLQQLRANGNATPVLILTARDGVQDRVKGLKRGADDYLGKPFDFEEFVARIEALLRRPGNFLGGQLRIGDVTLDTKAREFSVSDRILALPPRETAVLETLLRRAGHVVPKNIIEDQLYGLTDDGSPNAVEVHIHRLRKHLSDAEANVEIHTVRGVGYLIRERSA